MPRKSPKLILATERAAEARRIVTRQEQLVAGLRATGRPTLEAELYLQAYIEALKPLRGSRAKAKRERRAKRYQTEKEKLSDWQKGPPIRKGASTRRREGIKGPPTEMTLRSESHAARIDLSPPLYQCRLRPSPRKVKQLLFLVVALSVGGS